jgi:nitroreductase
MLKNFALFGAPHVALIHAPRDLGAYGALDCGAFITAFTLAAQALGVASIPQAAVASYGPFLHDHFAIPDDRMVLCGISFGYPNTQAPVNGFRTERATVADILEWQSD